MLAAPCARVLLLALCASAATGEALLKSWQLSVDGDTRGGLVAESWGTSRVDYLEERDASGTFVGVKVRGNNRLFSVNDYVWAHKWRDVSYKHWKLLNRALTFTLDLSGVGCGCNAAIYLVAMSEPEAERSGYCDIQSGYDDDFDSVQPCLEIDLLEGMWALGRSYAILHSVTFSTHIAQLPTSLVRLAPRAGNVKAVQATLHTSRGHGADGVSCNQVTATSHKPHPTPYTILPLILPYLASHEALTTCELHRITRTAASPTSARTTRRAAWAGATGHARADAAPSTRRGRFTSAPRLRRRSCRRGAAARTST